MIMLLPYFKLGHSACYAIGIGTCFLFYFILFLRVHLSNKYSNWANHRMVIQCR